MMDISRRDNAARGGSIHSILFLHGTRVTVGNFESQGAANSTSAIWASDGCPGINAAKALREQGSP